MSKYGTLVMGPAGAGKSTFCTALIQHLQNSKRPCFYVNLDPAAEEFAFEPDLDIKDLISLEDVMEEMSLGPNGGLIYCFEFLMENLDWLTDPLEEVTEEYLIVFDMPGQIELYTHVPILPNLVKHLMTGSLNIRMCAAYLLEATFVIDRPKFFSGTLSAMSAMMMLEMPHINILSKMDLVKGQIAKRDLKRFVDVDADLIEDDPRQSTNVAASTRRRDAAVKMKLNISYPNNGTQKLIEVDDERKLRVFMDRRMGQEVPADSIGDEFKGYIVRITGGNDKQGFPMKQGVMHPTRVRLLLADGHSCYRPRRTGERKRKSVRGCIVGMDLSVLALSIVKKGDEDIPGLTDIVHPKRLGPKRATKIRRFFGLSKEDDVRKFVIRREVQPKKEGAKPYTKAPKIQRLVTPQRLQHKRHRLALKRRRAEASKDAANEYAQILSKRINDAKAAHDEARKRRASSMKH